MRVEQRSAKRYNGKVSRERDARLWWQCVGAVAVGIFLAVGFAIAAQSHFAAHEYSLQNVGLQRERERLIAEQKRLLLERENALTLEELKKKAKKIGLQELTAEQINALDAEEKAGIEKNAPPRANEKRR